MHLQEVGYDIGDENSEGVDVSILLEEKVQLLQLFKGLWYP